MAVESWPFLSQGNAQQPRKAKLLASSTHASSNDLWSSSLISNIAVFVITSVVWAIVLILTEHRSLHIPGPTVANWTADHKNSSFLASEVGFLTCGQSIAEAKTKGCQYDILTNHWLPGPCADEFSIVETNPTVRGSLMRTSPEQSYSPWRSWGTFRITIHQ